MRLTKKYMGSINVTITDISGRILKNELFQMDNNLQKTYSLENFSDGTYFVTVIGNGIYKTQKIVVKR